MVLNIKLTEDQCENIRSAIYVWSKHLDKKQNPRTAKELKLLDKKFLFILTGKKR